MLDFFTNGCSSLKACYMLSDPHCFVAGLEC